MKLSIPKHPSSLSLHVDHLWNGGDCLDERVWADIQLSASQKGIHVRSESPVLHDQKIPDAPIGTRVDELWKYDVIELFFVGPGHRYVELELGAGGHYLFLSFESIRHRLERTDDFQPLLYFTKTPKKTWVSELLIPWKFLPENMRGFNVFVIAAGQYLSLSPLPGEKPNFHQPDFFPQVSLSY